MLFQLHFKIQNIFTASFPESEEWQMGRIYILLWIILEFDRGQIVHWPCRMFRVFFPRKSFLQWWWYQGHLSQMFIKMKCIDPSPPFKLLFPSTRLKDSYNNDVTISKRIRLADLKKKQKMQKVIFYILLLYEFFRRSVHPPDQCGLKSVFHWPLTSRVWAFLHWSQRFWHCWAKMELLILSLVQLLLCSYSHGAYRLPLALVWFKYQIFSSNIELLTSVFKQCSGREQRQAGASVVWQAL